jgi:acyl dehydratase
MPQRIIDGLTKLKELVGQEVGISDWFQVTQAQIDAFAEVTRDRQWIHLDSARAQKESPYRTTVAHGFLTLALVSHLHGQAVQVKGDFKLVINYGLNRVRFPAPVPAGSRIRTHSALKSMEDIPAGVQLIWAVTTEIEGQPKPALVAECISRLLLDSDPA